MPDLAVQTADEVIKAASAAGFEVSPSQLARWHRAGLVPRPRQQALGRGQGTASIYPSGTSLQVVAVCRLLEKHRSLDRAGFQLWWDGYDVPDSLIRGAVERAAREFDEALGSLAGGLDRHRSGGFAGLMSRRLGRKRLDQLSDAIREATTKAVPDSEPPRPLADIPMPPSMEEIVPFLVPMFVNALANLDATKIVDELSMDDFRKTRDQIKGMLAFLQQWAEPMAWLWGSKGTLFRLLAEAPSFISTSDLPDLILTMAILQRVLPTELAAVGATPTPPQRLLEIGALKAVHDQVPGADTVVTPAAIRALLRDKEAAGRYRPKIEAFLEEHRTEIAEIVRPFAEQYREAEEGSDRPYQPARCSR